MLLVPFDLATEFESRQRVLLGHVSDAIQRQVSGDMTAITNLVGGDDRGRERAIFGNFDRRRIEIDFGFKVE